MGRLSARAISMSALSPRIRKRIALTVALASLVSAVIVRNQPDPEGLSPAGPTFASAGCRTKGRITGGDRRELREWHDLVLPPLQDCYRLEPTRQDARGIEPATAFVLRTHAPLRRRQVARRLSTEPAVTLVIASLPPIAKERRFKVMPARPLVPGSITTLSLAGPRGISAARWAFQVATPLRVVQTLPRDRAHHVPTNVGIELTFSHDNVAGVEERFRIDPPTPGRFETHDRVVVFVPLEPLARRTIYTVRLAPGASVANSDETLDEEVSFRFETGRGGRDGSTPGPRVEFERAVWEAGTASPPTLGMFDSGGRGRPDRLSFTVYRYRGPAAFLRAVGGRGDIPGWAHLTRAAFRLDHRRLQTAATFDAEVRAIGRYGQLYVQFPALMQPGYYLVETADRGTKLQTLLQVTDVATYTAVSGRRTIVWVNDLASGSPLPGARVRAPGRGVIRTSDAEGVATFRTPEWLLKLRPSDYGETISKPVSNLVVAAPDGRTAVVPLSDLFGDFHSYDYREYTFQGEPAAYWRYLYVDRPLYHPTDSIRFWGLIRSRTDAGEEDVTLRLSGWQDDADVVLASTQTRTTRSGTFIGTLAFEKASPGWYSVDALVGAHVVASTSVEIRDFVKPAYEIEVTPRLRALYRGETARFDVDARFFEGTPVAGTDVRYRPDWRSAATVTTDDAGHAEVSFVARNGTPYGPTQNTLAVRPKIEEEGEIEGSAWVQVFPSALTAHATGVAVGDTATVRGGVRHVDLSMLNEPGAGYYEDYRGARARRVDVRAAITEEWHVRVKDGVYYDFISKIAHPMYRYEYHQRSLGTRTLTTDERGRFRFSFEMTKGRSYDVDVRVEDAQGRPFRTETWVTRRGRSFDYGTTRPYLSMDDQRPYRIGDDVRIVMRQGKAQTRAGGSNRYLFYEAQNGIGRHAVVDEPRYGFRFAERHVPNVSIIAVWFTGSSYEEVSYAVTADFDEAVRNLTIEVNATRPRYRPGERAVLDVRVTDRAGRPVVAEVLLGAVDEALYRAQGADFYEDLDILESLYRHVPPGILRVYASHHYPRPDTGAESGGEGGARNDFRDVALFDRVTTDRDGRASIGFDLPDNLTSWRVTALAVTDNLLAGSTVASVPVGLPFFVDLSLNDTYLVADRPTVRLRAFGDALRAGDPVRFTVHVPTLSPDPIVAQGTAFRPIDVPLPPLRDGEHRIFARARSGAHKDGMRRRFSVMPTRLLRMRSHYQELNAGDRPALVTSEDRRTTLVLTDHNRGRYLDDVISLAYTSGDRLDQMLARALARKLLSSGFGGVDRAMPFTFVARRYQTRKGGIAIFPFADADLTLTARVASLAADRFDRDRLRRYLSKAARDEGATRERRIIALYGLASLREPVLLAIQDTAREPDLNPRERLYLGLAAATLGDEPTATRLYRALLDEFGEYRGNMIRLNMGGGDDTLEATSLAAIIGATLGDDLAPFLFDYTTTRWTTDILIELEQIAYLTAAMPRLSADPVEFAYTHLGARRRGKLAGGRVLSLSLLPREVRALDLEVRRGRLGATTSFLASFDPAQVERDPTLSLARTIGESSDPQVMLDGADLVRIRLTFAMDGDPDQGCYQITDVLPSGLRPVSNPYHWSAGGDRDRLAHPYAIEGQRVSFCAWSPSYVPELVYYARVIATGTYVAEPALMQSQQTPSSITITEAQEVEIS